MVHKKDKATIGSISLMRWNDSKLWLKDTEAELWFWLWVPYWWQWLMPEAAKEMIRHWFDDMNLEKIWCCYFKENNKSKRVQEKCWFKYKETVENVECPLINGIKTKIIQCMTKEERQDSQK
jgi:RimJ/RimL family protein N-acetyltransferase